MSINIYNFVFPAYVNELSLGGYTFKRVPEYVERVRALHHRIRYFYEFAVEPNFGDHAITAVVAPPTPEPAAFLQWEGPTATHLDDVLLVLSLFTMRHVWPQREQRGVIVADHRSYDYGWAVRQGIPFMERADGGLRIDVGFEPGINEVLSAIRHPAWQAQYRGGHYLLLANHAFRRQILETTFSLCWTIWEHLFALHNDDWLDTQTIHRLSGKEKVAFVLSRYGLSRHVGLVENPSVEELVTVRNRLLHFGMFPTEASKQKAVDFIKWTEYLIAKTLGLYKAESFESMEEFETSVLEKTSPRRDNL